MAQKLSIPWVLAIPFTYSPTLCLTVSCRRFFKPLYAVAVCVNGRTVFRMIADKALQGLRVSVFDHLSADLISRTVFDPDNGGLANGTPAFPCFPAVLVLFLAAHVDLISLSGTGKYRKD